MTSTPRVLFACRLSLRCSRRSAGKLLSSLLESTSCIQICYGTSRHSMIPKAKEAPPAGIEFLIHDPYVCTEHSFLHDPRLDDMQVDLTEKIFFADGLKK